MKSSLGLLSFTVYLAFSSAIAAESDLEKRLSELEKRQTEMFFQMNEEKNRVKPFLRNEILLGGYFETVGVHVEGPRMDSQNTIASHILGLNIAAQLSDRDRFVTQVQTAIGYNFVNRHSDPRVTATPTRQFTTATATTLMAHAYYEHNFSQALNTQLGLGYVPFGISYQYREPVLFRRRGGDAQMVNQSATQDGGVATVGIAFPLWMGAHMYGSFQLDRDRWGYNLYTFSPTTNSKTIGSGARLWYQLSDLVTFGVSGQLGEQRTFRFQSHGADVDIKYKNYGLTMEFAKTVFDGPGPAKAPYSYYVTPYVEFADGKYQAFVFLDYLDNPTNVTQVTGFPADPYERQDTGAGINWRPLTNLRFRLTVSDHKYLGVSNIIRPDDRSFTMTDFSTVLAF